MFYYTMVMCFERKQRTEKAAAAAEETKRNRLYRCNLFYGVTG